MGFVSRLPLSRTPDEFRGISHIESLWEFSPNSQAPPSPHSRTSRSRPQFAALSPRRSSSPSTYLKQGYDMAVSIDCAPPRPTRMLRTNGGWRMPWVRAKQPPNLTSLEMEDGGMRAMQIIEWGKPLEAREYPDPEPTGEEVLLRVEAAGGVPQRRAHLGRVLRFGRRPADLTRIARRAPAVYDGTRNRGRGGRARPAGLGCHGRRQGGGLSVDRLRRMRGVPEGRGTALPQSAYPRHKTRRRL